MRSTLLLPPDSLTNLLFGTPLPVNACAHITALAPPPSVVSAVTLRPLRSTRKAGACDVSLADHRPVTLGRNLLCRSAQLHCQCARPPARPSARPPSRLAVCPHPRLSSANLTARTLRIIASLVGTGCLQSRCALSAHPFSQSSMLIPALFSALQTHCAAASKLKSWPTLQRARWR